GGGLELSGLSRTLSPVGGVMPATHGVLGQLVQKGTFREILYYRLNITPLTPPPLRERGDDIILLARYFVRKYADRFNKRIDDFTEETLEALVSYDWPGNVRELENVIERAVVLCVDGVPRPSLSELKRSIRTSSASSR